MELNSFYLKDFAKMILKIILEDDEQLVLAKIFHRSKMSAIMITPSSHSFQYALLLVMFMVMVTNLISLMKHPYRKGKNYNNKAPKTKSQAWTLITAKNGFFLKPHINKKILFWQSIMFPSVFV